MYQNSKPTPPPTAPKNETGERLQNVLSHRGVASRRHAADLIATGAVTVNGAAIYEPGFRVNPAADDICVRGERLPKETETARTILLYKPRGLISGADNAQGDTVCDYMRQFVQERLVPVGRLDKESEGLLLMSNDGELTHVMTHPRYGHTKTYIARVAGHMEERKIEILRSRLEIDGYVIEPVEVEILKVGRDHTHKLAFTLSEGRNRQIRKMCSLASFVVLDLTRVRIGPLKICNMQPGEWRELSEAEIRSLKKPLASPPSSGPRSRPPASGRPPSLHDERDRRPAGPRAAGTAPRPRDDGRPSRQDRRAPDFHPQATAERRPYGPSADRRPNR
jgi:pseudouridine synthase